MSFHGHVDSESIQVDEAFVEIHAEDDDDTNFEYDPPANDNDNDIRLDMDNDDRLNDWASQGFEHLSRRPPRSLQPRFTNPNQLSRGSCFF